jgi:hypothetical protein
MTVVTSIAALAAHVGATIVVLGEARNSKAGPLLFDSVEPVHAVFGTALAR